MKTIKYKLPKKIKNAWVKALRSGKYKQGEMKLIQGGKTNKKYCCLGVLCEIVGEPPQNGKTWIPSKYLACPKELRGDGVIPEKLAKMNDGADVKKRGFRGIATWIEKNL